MSYSLSITVVIGSPSRIYLLVGTPCAENIYVSTLPPSHACFRSVSIEASVQSGSVHELCNNPLSIYKSEKVYSFMKMAEEINFNGIGTPANIKIMIMTTWKRPSFLYTRRIL